MLSQKEKYVEYRKVIRISLLISLLSLSMVFYLFPRFDKNFLISRANIPVQIYVSDIPQTSQKQGRPLPPRRPESGIPIAVEDADLPQELSLDKLPGLQLEDEGTVGIPVEDPARPLLEVYPNVSGVMCKGFVSLLLLVNEKGEIESVQLLQNSTGSKKCSQMAIEAAKKSQWMPARVDNKPVSSWVEKLYKFNVKG